MSTTTEELDREGIRDIKTSVFGSRPSSKLTKTSTRTEDQQAALKELLAMLTGDLEGFDSEVNLTEQELAGQELMKQLIGGTGDIFKSLQDATKFDQEGIDDLFQTTIRDPLVRDTRENIIPEIAARFGNQFFSSERQNQEGRAIDTLVRTLAGEKNRLVQGERGRQIQALDIFADFNTSAAGIASAESLATKRGDIKDRQRKELMNLLLGATDQNTVENIVTGKPGQKGFVGNFADSFGAGLGEGASSFASFCWVAMVLYGYTSETTTTIRAYAYKHVGDNSVLGTFLRAYLLHGKSWADKLLEGKLPWNYMKGIWDSLYKLALAEKGVK